MEDQLTALKQMIIRQNIKQSELAWMLNVTWSSVSHNEKRGILCVKTAELYAAILHCRAEELMDFTSRVNDNENLRTAKK